MSCNLHLLYFIFFNPVNSRIHYKNNDILMITCKLLLDLNVWC